MLRLVHLPAIARALHGGWNPGLCLFLYVLGREAMTVGGDSSAELRSLARHPEPESEACEQASIPLGPQVVT